MRRVSGVGPSSSLRRKSYGCGREPVSFPHSVRRVKHVNASAGGRWNGVVARLPWRAFTLIELLTVLAIIGVLAAILVSSVASARVYALRVKTKVQFGQWSAAMEEFRREYGFYPPIDGGSSGKVIPALFAGALTGRTPDGSAAAPAGNLAGNDRRLSFYTPIAGELEPGLPALADAFGNRDIAVLIDRNSDGIINEADRILVGVTAQDATEVLSPAAEDIDLAAGLRGGVIFYSAGRGRAPADLVLSWK